MAEAYRVIVTGGRDRDDRHTVWNYLSALAARNNYELTVVHGDCNCSDRRDEQPASHKTGADKFADQWCAFYRHEPERHPAFWHKLGAYAGPKRNGNMARAGANQCGAFPSGRRPFAKTGTCNMVCQAVDHGIPVRIIPKTASPAPGREG